MVLIFAWNEFIFALFLTRAAAQTMPVLVSAQNATRGPQWWNISVLVLMMVVPIVILAIILERFIAKGILMGAVGTASYPISSFKMETRGGTEPAAPGLLFEMN